MEKIKLDSFELIEYDRTLEEHKQYAAYFESDKDYGEYMEPFWSLEYSIDYARKNGRYSNVYFAFKGNILVGMIGTIWVSDYPELVIGILKEHRGHHYSRVLIEEYTNYLFDTYKEYERIYAYIEKSNIHSKENVLAAGFTSLNEFQYVKKRKYSIII